MRVSNIFETKAYDLFELHEFNRDVSRMNELKKSMIRHGWIDAYPMHVVVDGNGKFIIKGGHHRFVVAKKLGIGVKYVVCDDSASMHDLEKSTIRWTINDYSESFARSGNINYIILNEYCKHTGIKLSCAIPMLAGISAGSYSNYEDKFKTGKYKVAIDSEHARIVGDTVVFLKSIGIKLASDSLFVKALSRVTWCSEFDHDVFRKKASNNISLFAKQPSRDAYLRLIDHVYNRASRERLPLVFLADEMAKSRNCTNKKSNRINEI